MSRGITLHVSTRGRASVRTSARAVALLILLFMIAAGAGFRFYRLEAHGFWGDEAITALRVAGHTSRDVIHLTEGHGVSADRIQRLERVSGSDSAAAVIGSLAAEDAQHPPLYYVLGYYWERATNGGPLSLRLLSALLSLLLLPAVYWLTYEITSSRTPALVAAALAAVSPYNVEYAQQAREYGLWAVMVCVASALLLYALRKGGARWWLLYSLSMALGYYTHTFMLLLLVAHAAYVLSARKRLERASLAGFGIAVAASLLAYLPWFWIVSRQYSHLADSGMSGYQPQSLKAALYAWIVALATPFFDLEFWSLKYFVVVAAVLALEVRAVIALVRALPFSRWFFIACLIASGALLQIGNRGFTDMPRYLVPTMMAVIIAVACWPLLYRTDSQRRYRYVAYAALFATMCICLFDDAVRATHRIWWTNYYGEPLAPIAARIDEVKSPIVAGTAKDWEVVFDEATLLRSKDRIVLDASGRSIESDLHVGRAIFALSRYPELADGLSRRFDLEPLYVPVRPHGYELIAQAKGASARTRIVWLWAVGQR